MKQIYFFEKIKKENIVFKKKEKRKNYNLERAKKALSKNEF